MLPFVFKLKGWFRSWQPPLQTSALWAGEEETLRYYGQENCAQIHRKYPPRIHSPGEVSEKQLAGWGRRKTKGTVPAVFNGAEPEKHDLGKSMILFILLAWCGLGRHRLRLVTSFILPHCSIKFYSLHLQSKSFHITLSAFFDPCDWKDELSAPLPHPSCHSPRHNQFQFDLKFNMYPLLSVHRQQRPTIYHRELCSMLCSSLDGRGVALVCTETITALLIRYT